MKRSSKRRRQQRAEQPDEMVPAPLAATPGDDAVVVVLATVSGVTHILSMVADVTHGETVGAQLQQLDPDVWAPASRKGTVRLVAESSGHAKTVAVDGRLAEDLEVVLGMISGNGGLDGGLTERLTALLSALRGRDG